MLTPPRRRRAPHPQFKIAAFVLAPLSLPAGLVTAIVYDEEFRDDVDRRFPEIGGWLLPAILSSWSLFMPFRDRPRINRPIHTRVHSAHCINTVDAVRQRVGFEEDLRRRRADLEKAFISSQRTCGSGQGGVSYECSRALLHPKRDNQTHTSTPSTHSRGSDGAAAERRAVRGGARQPAQDPGGAIRHPCRGPGGGRGAGGGDGLFGHRWG